MKNKMGLISITIISLIPIALWVGMESLSQRFSGYSSTMTSLGQLTALFGMTLFSISLILSGRFKFMEDYFGGLNKIYVNHHTIGGLAFSLLLLHPVFLTLKFLSISTKAAALFLLNPFLASGTIGLLIMIILMVMTLYLRPSYEKWKLSHKFLGLAFLFGGLHMMSVNSDVSRNPILRYYMFSLAIIASIAFLYRSVFGSYLVKKYKYRLDAVNKVSENVFELVLSPTGDKMNYNSGQFIFLNIGDENIGREVHPFSIASSPKDEKLKIVFKILGDFTQKLPQIKLGSEVLVEGPYGKFNNEIAKNKDQIWIAGGIGITPFISLARNMSKETKATLYYSLRNESEAVFLSELSEISNKNNNFKVAPFYSDAMGRISAKFIKDKEGVVNKDIFICGPGGMMQSLKEQFGSLGVNKKNIHNEEFGF